MDKHPDYLSYLPIVQQPVVVLLTLPPASRTPSGFYKIEPDGTGANKYTLLLEVQFDPRQARGWFAVAGDRAEAIRKTMGDRASPVAEALEEGAMWMEIDPLLFVKPCNPGT